MWIDTAVWPRRATWQHYLPYELPFFNLTAPVEVTATRAWCRAHDQSFFLATWWVLLRSLQPIPAFRQRLRGDRVWEHERLSIASTVLADDGTVRFCRLETAPDFTTFANSARAVVEAAKASPPGLVDHADRDDLVFGTVVPWVAFTSISHARRLGGQDSIPRFAVGKAEDEAGRVRMPVSVEAHHALVDGLHAGQLFQGLTQAFADPDATLGQPPRTQAT